MLLLYLCPGTNTSSSLALPSELPALPSELRAQLLSAQLVWVCRGGAVPPLQPLYDGPYAVIRRGGRSFTLQVGPREEIVAVSRLKACTTADAVPGSPRPTAGQTPRRICRGPRRGRAPKRLRRGQAGNVRKPLGLYTFSNGAAAKRSRNCFPTQRGGFCTPGTGGAINVSTAAESAAPADTAAKSAAVSATPADTASEDGPLTSSLPSRGQSSGGALWRPVSCCCIAVQQRHDICYVQCTVPAIKAVLCIEIN
jgi:hypothetical protein